jgi:PAS domain S-box-containing protein
MAGFLVMRGDIMDYSKIKKAQLIEEIEALQEKIVEPERAEGKRKQAEEALRTAARQWRTTFDAIGDAVCLMDVEGRMLRCNKAMTKLLGKPFGKVIGRTCWEFVHGTSKPIEGCPVVRMRETRRRETLVLPIGDRWVEIVADPLLDEAGDLIGSVHIMSDITERKRAEEALRESEERLQGLVETMVEGMIFITPDGEIVQANPAAERILGLKRSEIEARNYIAPEWEILRPDGTPMPPEEMAGPRAMKEKCLVKDVVMGAKRPDGSISWINVSATPLINETGGLEGVVGTFADITERKRAEETIRRQLAEIASYYDNAPIGLAALDTNLRYLRINDRLAEINGIPAAAHIGKTVKEIVPTLEAQAREVTAEILGTGQPVTDIEFSGETAAQPGVNRSWLESWHPLKGETGNIIGFVVMVLEITERKRAEEELRNAYKQLLDIIDFLPDATFVINMDKKVIAWNRAMEEMTGVHKEEIMGQGDYAYAVPFYGIRRQMLIDLVLSSDEEIESRYDYIKRKGNTLIAEVFLPLMYEGRGGYLWGTAAPLLNGEDKIIGAIESIRDITERKRAEEELIRLSSVVKTSGDTIGIIDMEGKIIDVNEAALKMYGTDDKGDLIGKHMFHFIAPEQRERALAGMEAVLERGYDRSRGYDIVTKDGSRVPVEMSAAAMKGPDGKPIGLAVIGRDITEQLQAEEALRERLKELTCLYSVHRDMQEDLPTDGLCRRVVEHLVSAMEFPGITVPVIELDGRRFTSEKYTEALSHGLHAEISVEGEARGHLWVYYAEDRPFLIPHEQDLLNGIAEALGVWLEHKQAEEALQESEERYRQLVELSPDTIAVHSEGKIVFINTAGARLLGAANPEQLVGKPIMDFLHPDYRDTVRERIGRIQEGKEAPVIEEKFIRFDRTVIDVEVTTIPFTYQGKPAVQTIAHDITERKRVEEMKDNLIRDVSHELKTPLAKMQMGVDLLMEMVGAPSMDRQKVAGVSEMIGGNVQRLQHTVNNILDLSSLESGQMPYHKTKLQLKNLIRRVILDIQPLAEGKGLELVVELPESLPRVKGDQERLLRVLTNLVDNAVKFTDEGKIVISAKKKAHEVEITVSDSGHGILGKNLDKVFERFWQERASIPGAGVGLAICKTIVEAHDGSIWAESAGRGQGTTIRFTLPFVNN